MSQTVVEQLMVELKARTDQAETRLAQVERQLDRTAKKGKEAGAAAGQLGGRYAGAAQQMASAAEQMARSGQVSGDAAKQMIQQGASMALMFGAGGPIIAAVAIAGLAIFEMFDKTRREMEETRRKAEEELNQMARSRDVGGLARKAQELYEGDMFARPDLAEDDKEKRRRTVQQMGIVGTRAEIAKLMADMERGELGQRGMRWQGGQHGGRMVQDVEAAREEMAAEIKRWQGELRQLEGLHEETQKLLFGDESAGQGTRRGLGAVGLAQREESNRLALEAQKKAEEDLRRAKEKGDKDAEREAEQAIERTRKQLQKWGDDLAVGMKTVQDAVLKGTATMLDDMRASIVATQTELEKAGVPPSLIQQWEEVAEAGFRAQAAAEQTAAAFRDVGSPKTVDGLTAGISRLQGLEQALISARDKEAEGSQARATIEKLLADTTEKRVQLTQQLGRAALAPARAAAEEAEAAEKAAKAREEAAKHIAEMATEIAMVARGALAAADAFGAMSDSTRDALNNVVNLGEGIAKLIASGGTDVGAWVQSIGSVASLASGALGLDEAREEKRRREANHKVVEDLQRFSSALDEAVERLQSFTGNQFDNLSKGIDYLVSQTATMAGGTNVTNIHENLRAWGSSWEEATAIAEAHGIAWDDTVDSLRKLQDALQETRAKFAEFSTSVSDYRAYLDLRAKAFGTERSSEQQLYDLVNAGGMASGALGTMFSEALQRGGVVGLREQLQQLVETLAPGGASLDPSLIGTMTPEEFRAYISDLLDAIGVLEEELAPRMETAVERLTSALGALSVAWELGDVSDPGERLRQVADAFAEIDPVLADLADGLDLTTRDGLATLDERIRALYQGVKDGTVVIEGFTVDEIIEALLGIEAAGDAAADAMAAAAEATEASAQALREYTRALEDDLAVRELLADGNRAGADMLGLQQQHRAEWEDAIAKGVSEETLAWLKRVQDKEVAGLLAQQAAKDAAEVGGGRAGPTSVIARAGAASVDTLVGIANTGLALDRERNALLAAVARALTAGAVPIITPPAVASGGSGSGGIVVHQSLTFYGPVTGSDEVRGAVAQGGRDIAAELQRRLDTQRRVEGRAEVI